MTPEQDRFVKRVMLTVEKLALRFAGEPDDKVEALLADLKERWAAGFCDNWPGADPEEMEAGARCIVTEVRKRRRVLGMD
jgi:hypothetical protein